MALNGGVNVKAILVLIKLALLISSGVFAGPAPGGGGVFDVTQFGAKPDGKSDNALALIRAWNAACKSTGTTAKLVIPTGNFKAGEVVFMGPCTSKVTVQLDGNLLASTDLSDFSMGVWITIQKVTDMVLTGGGTINGQGEANWRSNACKGSDCNNLLPDSLVVKFMTNFVMRGVKFVNSKGYHMKVNDCNGVTLDGLHITAPDESPNTDGIHISRTNGINITRSTIGTGDDCISIGEGSVNVNVFQVTCGPGHGISIGSLGKRAGEQNVKGITVTNCTLTGTTNGARIKSVHNSPKLTATSIVYQDIIMNHVQNPIIIDQNYQGRAGSGASNVQISDVHFRNIRGTTTSLAAVTLHCSSAVPCTGVELSNIDIAPAVGLTKFSALTSSCENAKASFTGRQNPTPCNGQKSGPAAPGNPLPPQKPSPVPTPPVKNPLPPKKPPPQKPSPVPTPPVKNPLPPKKSPPQKPSPVPKPPAKNPLPPKKPPPQSPSPPKKSPGKPQPPPKKKSPPPPPPSKGNKKNKGKTQKKSKKQGKKCKNGKCQ